MSHDWPRGIEQFGDVQNLVRMKPFFKNEASMFNDSYVVHTFEFYAKTYIIIID